MQKNILINFTTNEIENFLQSGHRRNLPQHNKGHNKSTANIIPNDEKLKALLLSSGRKECQLITIIQYRFGSTSMVIR